MRFRSSVAMAMSPPVVLSLRAISGECCVKASSGDGFVRFVYLDLVCSGSRVQIPFLGSLFSVDWDLLLRRQASDPLLRVEATAVGSSPVHSTFQVHAQPSAVRRSIQRFKYMPFLVCHWWPCKTVKFLRLHGCRLQAFSLVLYSST